MYGQIIIISRKGNDGRVIKLVDYECVIGRGNDCDIRVQLPTVSWHQCRIQVKPNKKVNIEINHNYI